MDDNDDYELASLIFGIAITLLILFALVGIAGLAAASLPFLPVAVVGLAVLAGGLFAMVGVAQLLVPQLAVRDRGSAMSLHLTIYYLLGSLGPFVLGAAWDLSGWAGAVLLALAAWAMKNLAAGRFIYAFGTDAEAARLAGINPRRTTLGAFTLLGALTGLAAVMNVVQSPQVQPTCGAGLELKVIAACVVGGVAVNGGRGNLWGVFAGLLLLAMINPALTSLHVEAHWEKAIQGLVILLAVVADGLRTRRSRR
jgi:rhamnose transport system permease protein